MKKKWIVIPSLLVLAITGAVAAPASPQPPGQENKRESTLVVDHATRLEVIDTLAKKLNAYYVFPDKARQIETALRQRQREGKYDAMSDGKQFAIQLTDDMRNVVRDKHMSVFFSPGRSRPTMQPDRHPRRKRSGSSASLPTSARSCARWQTAAWNRSNT